jgi:hypothetical protein
MIDNLLEILQQWHDPVDPPISFTRQADWVEYTVEP